MSILTKRTKQLEREKKLREEMIKQAKAGVKEALARKDLIITQAVRALDDLDQAKSLLTTRLKEMFSLNFPELELSNEESYAAVAAAFGRREDLKPDELEMIVGDKSQEVLLKARKSYGAAFDEADKVAVQELGAKVKGLSEARNALQSYLDSEAGRVLANLTYLTDSVLAARLVAAAGGLEKLAMMPASTIQVLGAEKALFKHLRAGTKPPKHGVIFQSAFIRGAPWSQRGKIARDLATKLAIAAKADFFTQNFIAPKLKERFEKRLLEIQAMPPRPEPKPYDAFERRGGRRFEGRGGGNRFESRGNQRFDRGNRPQGRNEGGYERRERSEQGGGQRPRQGGGNYQDRPQGGRPRFGQGGPRREGGERPRGRYQGGGGRRPFDRSRRR